uniref:Uncharacterized protein n=1 Tax=Arundo donax TaxID=35708 RepID=A0A0A9GXI8_ARUDO
MIGTSSYSGQQLTARKQRQSTNLKRGRKWKQKGTGSWAIPAINGAICWDLRWLFAPSSSPIQCIIFHDRNGKAGRMKDAVFI